MAREFAEKQQVQLQVSRPDGPATSCTGEVFAVLELLRPNGDVLLEFASDLWTLRTDWVWGAFWSMLLPPATAAVRFCVHRSLIFTEPLLGCVDLRIDELPPEALCTRWHALRAKDAGRANAIVGEVLLSVRRYRAASSVSPAAHVPTGLEDDDDDDAFGMLHIGPPQHAAAAIAPVEEPLFDVRVKG